MKRLLILLFITVLTESLFATFPFGRVIIKNDTLFAYNDLFKKLEKHDSLNFYIEKQILEFRQKDNPEGYLTEEVEESIPFSTWKIEGKKIYLTNISQYSNKSYDIDLKKLFNGKELQGKVFADWLTDSIIISKGKIIVEGWSPVRNFEKELILKNGIVIKQKNYKNYFLRKSNFEVNEKFIYKNIHWESLPDIGNKFIQASIGINPNRNGELNKIDEGSFVMIDSQIITDKENPFLKEAIRIAELVPEWNVIIRRDKILTLSMTINFHKQMKQKYAR